MALSPDDFYAHALAATDDEQRLPVWDDLLPTYPDDLARADAETVAEAVSRSCRAGTPA
jgi:hypothetical protein